MNNFLGKLSKSQAAASAATANSHSPSKKQHQPQPAHLQTPIEQLLLKLGPTKKDGNDKFFGMHNPSNTCYFNSVIQCLYHAEPFREHVLAFPFRLPQIRAKSLGANNTKPEVQAQGPNDANGPFATVNTRQTYDIWGNTRPKPGQPIQLQKPDEDKTSFEYQKKHAMSHGPFMTIDASDAHTYGMPESMFTTVKDMFEAIIAHDSRTGVITPVKSLEVLRSRYDIFRGNFHQDAHEFLNLLLNEIVEEVEKFSKEHQGEHYSEPSWVHSLFEGTLTSETRCLSCGNASQRDEVFLDLSVDLEEHSSVTACLAKFSEEEMLSERNKFHCDTCSGLQEAEKRMKVKRMPKILALHLKRFKYIEQSGTMQKLFHRVVYPFHLRLQNTTDDAEDPDKLYELFAIIIHLGSTPTHGHYVSIVKTKHGWALLDDELVIPVDKTYVRNFFGGGNRHPATAYVLFYQETTAEAVRQDQDPDDILQSDIIDVTQDELDPFGVSLDETTPTAATPLTPFDPDASDHFTPLKHTVTTPSEPDSHHFSPDQNFSKSAPGLSQHFPLGSVQAERERESVEEDLPELPPAKSLPMKGALRSTSFKALRHPSLSFRKRPNLFSRESKEKNELKDSTEDTATEGREEGSRSFEERPPPPTPTEAKKSRFSLGRKKSTMLQ